MKKITIALLLIAMYFTVYSIFTTTDCLGKRSYGEVYIKGGIGTVFWIASIGAMVIKKRKRNVA